MGTEKKAAVEVQETQTEQTAVQVQAPVAYCGPTIKGIAPQYTVFVDGLPDKLKEKGCNIPELTIDGPGLSILDKESIIWGLNHDLDSFCQS